MKLQLNLAESGTKAFLKFHKFHERLNRGIKTTAVSLALLEHELASNGAKANAQVKSIAYKVGGIWGGMPDWSNLGDAIGQSRHDLGTSGVIKAFSAFDVFMETLESELHAWNHAPSNPTKKAKKPPEPTSREDAAEEEEECPKVKVIRFYERHDWDIESVTYAIPIYTYYRLLRNCVAHSDGIATPALAMASEEDNWKTAIDNWHKKTSDKTSPTPIKFRKGDEIKITHREAILASSLLRNLAWDMTKNAVAELGELGMYYLIVSRALKKKDPIIVGGKTYFSKLHAHLENKFRIKNITNKKTRELLETLDYWEDFKSWHEKLSAINIAAKAQKYHEQKGGKNGYKKPNSC